jgi:RimJ/RimL family protein N-acetyltransferase
MELTCRRFERPDLPRLRAMYLEFEPKGAFQGLPPETEPSLDAWLHQLCDNGVENFVVDAGECIVGHTMLCPGPSKAEGEIAIFMHQQWRGFGAGRALLLGALNYGCKQLQFDKVWLSVQGANVLALHLFESIGFRPVGGEQPFAWELEMSRPSNCEQCKEQQCEAFRATLPVTIRKR